MGRRGLALHTGTRTAPGARPAAGVVFGRLRSRAPAAIVPAWVPGCAAVRAVTPRPPMPGRSAGVVAIRPPAPAAPDLHRLANPRIDVWEHRLRAQPSLR